MTVKKLPKDTGNRIGRAFALLFNRSAMYNVDHPFTTQALSEFHAAAIRGLTLFSPIVLIMHQEQFFIEEEPLDHRINTAKMAAHFKKADIHSISFEKGLDASELTHFVGIFIDIAKHVDAETMRRACAAQGIRHIRINHVFYQKITADDEVVDRRMFEQFTANEYSGETGRSTEDVLGVMAESVLMAELEKSLSLQSIIENPGGVSEKIMAADQSAAESPDLGATASGDVIMDQLKKIRAEIDRSAADAGKSDLSKLADAVFAMKRDLLEGLSVRKAEGVFYHNEQQILAETEALTDQVLLQLIRDEYQRGKITVQRLAQILRRLVPEPAELQRLMPKIKTALLAEGMPLREFLQLTRELKRELQSEDLAAALEKSAAELGVSVDILIEEVNRDPKSAAELIYLASEIRSGAGDENVLSELLVDYIERIGSEIALDTAEKQGKVGDRHLRGLISKIEATLVERLKNRDLSSEILHKVAERLGERMEDCLATLKSRWTTRHEAADSDRSAPGSGFADENAAVGPVMQADLQRVPAAGEQSVAGADPVDTTMTCPDPEPLKAAEEIKALMPEGLLDRGSILYILEKEIERAVRYETPFTVMMLSVYKVTPVKPLPVGAIDREQIMHFVLEKLVRGCRRSDITGLLDRNKFIALMPMTTEKNARAAMRRILKSIHDASYRVAGTPVAVKLAGTVTSFDKDRSASLDDFVKRAESDIFDMVTRLRNIQSIY
jgi:GGDEF domain-containing protein